MLESTFTCQVNMPKLTIGWLLRLENFMDSREARKVVFLKVYEGREFLLQCSYYPPQFLTRICICECISIST